MRLKRIVDGGYLSWVFGASSWGFRAWTNGSYKEFEKKTGTMILMDGPNNLRKRYDETYKAQRKIRYEADDDRMEAKERVDSLREDVIMEDGRLWTVQIEGLEADDLIAAMVYGGYITRDVPVIGVDKDLLQLPPNKFMMSDRQGKEVQLERFVKKLPAGIRSSVTKNEHIPLVLSLLGDKSDNVPKVVSKSKELASVLSTKNPYQTAATLYGEDFYHNLWMVLLPYPDLVDPVPGIYELPSIMDKLGTYWVGKDYKIRNDILETIDNVILGV